MSIKLLIFWRRGVASRKLHGCTRPGQVLKFCLFSRPGYVSCLHGSKLSQVKAPIPFNWAEEPVVHLGTPKNNFVMVASLSTLGLDGFATKVPPTSRRFKNTTCSAALFPLEQVRIPQSGWRLGKYEGLFPSEWVGIQCDVCAGFVVVRAIE